MKISQATLMQDPVADMDAVTKRYVDDLVTNATGSILVGNVYVTDITPTTDGIVGFKQYDANTVPANLIINTATSNTQNVRVYFTAEGGSSVYVPTVAVNGVMGTITDGSSKTYTGYADITIMNDTNTITVESSTGSTNTCTVYLQSTGPTILSVDAITLPGVQTEAKTGDTLGVSGIVGNAAVTVQVLSSVNSETVIASLSVGSNDSGGIGYKTFSGTFVCDAATAGSVILMLRAVNSLGTAGAVNSSTAYTVNLTYPTLSSIVVTYPDGQTALKDM